MTSILCGLLATGCQHRTHVYGGGVAERQPQVTLESVTPTSDSKGRGYPTSHFPMPVFPRELVRAGVAGEVVVRLSADEMGRVVDGVIVKSTQRELEAPVLNTTRLWRFDEFPDPRAKQRVGLVVDCVIKFSFLED